MLINLAIAQVMTGEPRWRSRVATPRPAWLRRVAPRGGWVVALLCLFALSPVLSATEPVAATAANALDPLQEALRQRVDEARYVTSEQAQRADSSGVAAFYEARSFRPAWQTPSQRQALGVLLDSLVGDGLSPGDYPLDLGPTPTEPAAAAALDWASTRSLLLALQHLYRGKLDPRQVDAEWGVEARALDVDALAQQASAALDQGQLSEFFAQTRPQHPLYAALRQALLDLLQQQQAGGEWTTIPAGPTLDPGASDPRIEALRARMIETGLLATDTAVNDAAYYDESLAAAVRRYQQRNLMSADGRVGKATLSALNQTRSQRIVQIKVNLERARWHLHELRDRLLLVDIAGYRATLFDGSTPLWSGRVQVGRSLRQTPVLKSAVSYLTLNPSWTIPPTILRQDVYPKLRKSLDYLSSNQVQVLDPSGRPLDPTTIDWSRPGAVVLRQDPGPHNALGRLVIRFPNAHMVYLHDTPSQALFEREQRAFSSGCIRVENIRQLAVLLLDSPQWSPAALDAAIDRLDTQTLPIERRVPILLMYWTVDVGADGSVGFKPDIYERDPAVARALGLLPS